MPRKPRIEFFGATYHIIQRGNNRAYIFENSEDKIKLLSILGEVKELFDFNLIAYCIMSNHYHFLIKTYNIPISKIMHRINTLYAIYYNNKYERTGSPFEGRYRGLIVQNDYYLLTLINYIHNNPVYKNMVKSMAEYKWSSDIFYRMNLESVVDIDYFLDTLSMDRQAAIKKYKELMSVFDADYIKLKQDLEGQSVIGEEDNELHLKKKQELDEILMEICNKESDFKLIKSGSRKSYLIKYKYKYIEECIKRGFSHDEIGQSINITDRAIRKYLNSKVSS